MRVAIDAVLESGKLCEAAICYSGNLSSPHERKYTLDYYLKLARELKAAGTHILGIKDMAGLCQPRAAYDLVKALREETDLPVHFHTHDTSGIAAASVFAAIAAGADAVDAAMDSMSGLTSQPNLGSIVEALRFGRRDPGLDGEHIRTISHYWARCENNMRRSKATIAPAPRKCMCTACRAGSTRICANRRARWASTTHAGRKSREPTPTSTTCLAMSSR